VLSARPDQNTNNAAEEMTDMFYRYKMTSMALKLVAENDGERHKLKAMDR
jgi:hypothetical protein